jgi:Zn finger protein HypA/HybF involved in hydrogenase expression
MHELSIARALLQLAAERVPPGGRLRAATLTAGPMQAIDPRAMTWAWDDLTRDSPWAGAALRVDQRPWRLRCGACGAVSDATELGAPCPACGVADAGRPVGGDELLLESIEVDLPASHAGAEVSHAGACSGD